MAKKSRLQEEYERMYLRLNEFDRKRFWVQLSHESRETYTRVESFLAKVAHSELSTRIIFKPEV